MTGYLLSVRFNLDDYPVALCATPEEAREVYDGFLRQQRSPVMGVPTEMDRLAGLYRKPLGLPTVGASPVGLAVEFRDGKAVALLSLPSAVEVRNEDEVHQEQEV
jgi:hypothetical protein